MKSTNILRFDEIDLHTTEEGVTELILNENCKGVGCWNNQLKELILNENCKKVWLLE